MRNLILAPPRSATKAPHAGAAGRARIGAMRVPGRPWIVSVGAAVVVVALAGASIQHVADGHVAFRRTRLVSTGWTVHPPFAPLTEIAARGSLSVPSVSLRTKEGSVLGFQLDLDYALAKDLSPQMANDIRLAGFPSAVGSLAQRVLEDIGGRIDTESLLSNPATTEGPLHAALEGTGIGVERLAFRSRLGDEIVRRTRTEEARALARPARARVLVIGWDGADWNTAVPLVTEGRMPQLARVMKEGAWTNLRSFDPMFSPLLWTTVATGKAPTEHGIADFLVKDRATGDRRPITSDFRKVKALWNILSDFDRRSAWIAWWASYPAETTRGLIVTDYLSAALGRKGSEASLAIAGVVSPAGALDGHADLLVSPSQVARTEVERFLSVTEGQYRAALEEIGRAPEKGKKGENAQNRVEDPVGFLLRVIAMTRTHHNIALMRIRAGDPVVGVYYEGIDMVGHGFQHYLPPKMAIVKDAEFERLRDVVPRFYAWQDELLGELIRAAGPQAITLILSDHGFKTGDARPAFAPSTKGQPEEWHRDWGILALHGPGIRPGVIPPASIYDIAPTILYLSGLPLAEDMPGRLVDAAFDPSVLRDRPPARIRSFELVGDRFAHASAAPPDSATMQEMMANLRALGYIGGGDEPRAPSGTSETASAGATETQYFYHRNLAVMYIRQGRYRDAESELLLANARRPQGKTYAMLSEVRATLGRFAEAASALEDGWRTVPEQMEPSSILWLVELHLLTGDQTGARAAVAAWSSRTQPAVRLAVEGRLQDASGDAAAAVVTYAKALDADPLLVRVVQRLQELNASRGQPFAIEPFLLRTLASHPEVDAYWDLAGSFALSRGESALAVERFQRASNLQPEDGLYLGHLASALAAAGRDGEARDALAWSERFPPSRPDAWMAIGGAWDRLGEPDRALEAFDGARRAGLQGPGADIGSALALARAGRASEAKRILDDAARRFPGNGAVQRLRGQLGG